MNQTDDCVCVISWVDLDPGVGACVRFQDQTDVKGIVKTKGFLLMVLSMMKEGKNHTLFETQMTKIDILIITKKAKTHTLWARTYLYSPYKGVPPRPTLGPGNLGTLGTRKQFFYYL